MEKRNVALIPAYEPEKQMVELLEKLWNAGFETVVVDDGSGPAYAEIFEEASEYAVILTHEENMGKGQALKTGLSFIQAHYGKEAVIVTVDADGQHTPEDAKKLCGIAADHPDTLVLGSRALKENVPLRSRFGNTVTRFVYRLASGVKVHDTQTGLRAFCTGLIPALLETEGARYEYEMNVLLKFAKARIPILEEEIETIYLNGNASSHFNTLKDSCRVYRVILRSFLGPLKQFLKFSVSSLVGFLTDYLMFAVFVLTGAGLVFSNIAARIVSASVNFALNRKYVFQSRKSLIRSVASYVLLASLILAGNTLVLSLLVNTLGISRLAAKLLTEILFFTISFTVQKQVIFRGKEDNDESASKQSAPLPARLA